VRTRLRVGAVLGGAYITALVRRSLGEGGSGPPILSRSKPCYAEGIVSKIVKIQHFQAKNGQIDQAKGMDRPEIAIFRQFPSKTAFLTHSRGGK
jgi:hypothetical protein